MLHFLAYYVSYLIFPVIALCFYFFYLNRKKIFRIKIRLTLIALVILFSLIFIYARFIEPQIIVVKESRIETGFPARIVILADLHLGIYKNQKFLNKTIDIVNRMENIDAVLIPGDLSFHPDYDQNLTELYAPFKNLRFPAYAVFGNHDSEKPGPPIQNRLRQALIANNVIFLKNTSAKITNTEITILGLGDNWADEDDVSQIENFKENDKLIVMTHNPDTVFDYPNSIPDITIAGHTHGGQLRIPFLYKRAIPCVYDFDQGLYELNHGKIFVSTGLGETGLPLRLGIPPRIDLLELY